MQNFIHIFNLSTQKDLLENISDDSQSITIWQSLEFKKKLMKVTNVKLNLYDKQLELTPKRKIYSFDSKLPVYFFSSHRTSIFKTRIIFNSNFKVILRWPENFLIEDERDNERFYHRKNKNILFKLRINNQIDKEFQKPIIDESHDGLSIRVPPSELQYYDEGASVKIKYKEKSIFGRISYISPLQDKMFPHHMRVGIVFLKLTQ